MAFGGLFGVFSDGEALLLGALIFFVGLGFLIILQYDPLDGVKFCVNFLPRYGCVLIMVPGEKQHFFTFSLMRM